MSAHGHSHSHGGHDEEDACAGHGAAADAGHGHSHAHGHAHGAAAPLAASTGSPAAKEAATPTNAFSSAKSRMRVVDVLATAPTRSVSVDKGGHAHAHGSSSCSGDHGAEAAEEDGGHGHSAHGHSHGGSHGHAHGGHDDHDDFGVDASRALLHDKSGGMKQSKTGADNSWARRKLLLAGGLCFLFMIGEFVGGFLASSLAIMTDAAHLLSDLAGFLISLAAVWLAERPANAKLTFGYHRYEVLGAMTSVFLIWFIAGVLVFEAVERVINPQKVDGKIMFITAICGMCVNLAMMKILHQDVGGGGHGHSHGGHGHAHGGGGHDDHENINVKAAFIHVIGDLVQSIGVVIASIIIWIYPSAHLADPICTFIFSILVLFTTINILRQAAGSLLNAVPGHIDYDKVMSDLQAIPGASAVHDLHIWAISSRTVALSVHILATDPSTVLLDAQKVCKRHKILHSTIQVERLGSHDLANCEAGSMNCTPTALMRL